MRRCKCNRCRNGSGNCGILHSMSTTTFQFESFEAFSPFSGLGPYRAADYWQLPEGERVELIKGRFVVSPSPNVLHQTIVGLLFDILSTCARKSGSKVLLSPMDVILSDDTILQPDLLYISKSHRHIIKQRVEGAPDLVIEVISGTSRRDRIEKLDLYAIHEVSEYWIVDPAAQIIEFLVRENGRFVIQSAVNDRYQSPRLPEVEIQVADFWRQVDREMSAD
jgi:Uma2 family endonuclease